MSRLEEIKDQYDWTVSNGLQPRIDDSELEWLIEQAERVQELEIMLKVLGKQNKRYREALKNIYELAEYDEYDNTLEQIVSEVEKALEGEE